MKVGEWFTKKYETGGMCNKQEQALHINPLEQFGGKLGRLSFLEDNKDIKHIRVMMDNNTAVAFMNIMGGVRSDLCGDIAFDIWQLAAEQQLCISAAHIPRSGNVIADKISRMFERSSEWKHTEGLFKQIVGTFGKRDIDLFPSRINHQLSNYISCRPDPAARAIDAFSIYWSTTYNYCSPPFCIILKDL